jgi:hypothetical protein
MRENGNVRTDQCNYDIVWSSQHRLGITARSHRRYIVILSTRQGGKTHRLRFLWCVVHQTVVGRILKRRCCTSLGQVAHTLVTVSKSKSEAGANLKPVMLSLSSMRRPLAVVSGSAFSQSKSQPFDLCHLGHSLLT